MDVQGECHPGDVRVSVDLTAGEYLEYRVPNAGDAVAYVLKSDQEGVLFDRPKCPPPATYRWPPEGATAGKGEHRHTLGMVFLAQDTIRYEVDRCDGSGVRAEVKRCVYRSSGPAQDHFSLLRVQVL